MLVAAANLKARAEGIRPRMRLSEATALVDTLVREHDVNEDMEVLCDLAEQAQQFSPIVGLEQLDKSPWAGRTLHQPECLLLDVTGLAALFQGEDNLMRQVAEWLAKGNYFAWMGLAGSVGAAWATANYAARASSIASPSPSRSQSPRKQPPQNEPLQNAGCSNPEADESSASTTQENSERIVPECRCTCVPRGEDEWATSQLPLPALRLSTECVTALQRLGIHTIGALATLPRDGMATRLGDQLILRWDQALGVQSEPIVTLHSRPDWCLEQSLEIPTLDRETIAELVKRLSRELAGRLQRRGEGALRLLCRLDLVESQPLMMQIGLFRPTCDTQHFEHLLNGQLEQQMRLLGEAPLWRISLQATLTAPLVWRQSDLFEGGEVANRQQIAQLVDMLSSRLGRKQILSIKAKREAQPELAFQLQPMTGRRADGSDQTTIKKLSSRLARGRVEPSRDDPLRRPSHLLESPVSIDVGTSSNTDKSPDAPTTHPVEADKSDHDEAASRQKTSQEKTWATAPELFKYQGTWHRIVTAWGPERLESGWWRGPSARRDYYRVCTENGSWWWIYRDLNSGQWYMHGLFD